MKSDHSAATRLAAFLASKKCSHRAFAALAGFPALHPMVSQWLSGARRPGLGTALAIERATAGAVPASSWPTSRRSSRRTA